MRLVHFTRAGGRAGGIERYLETLLASAGSPFTHEVVFEEGDRCDFAGRWSATRAAWSTDPPGGVSPIRQAPDAIAVFHAPPSRATLEVVSAAGRAVAFFCHDHRWWCPSGSRFHHRTGQACAIRAGTLPCTLRYHALHCGSLRPGAFTGGLRRAALGRSALVAGMRVLTASSWMRQEAIRHGADAARAFVIPLPVEPGRPDATPANPPEILFASRLTPEKGPALLLEAFARMRSPARLIIAGTGIAAGAMADAVARHPRQSEVTMAGELSADAVRERMRAASVVVVPSRWPEPFGLVGVEALAEGRQVVACDTGGISDWARPDLGVRMVPPGRADLLATALDAALGDVEGRERARTSGPGWVASHHSLAVHLDRLEAAFSGSGS